MKNYIVTVNGNKYEVSVEEVNSDKKQVDTIKPEKVIETTGKNKITSPMAGKIVDVLVAIGDRVEKGKPVIVLEAMKMENEIVSNFSGSVSSISITKGNQVSSGDTLIIID